VVTEQSYPSNKTVSFGEAGRIAKLIGNAQTAFGYEQVMSGLNATLIQMTKMATRYSCSDVSQP
jgi:hypothetical protein